jgi:DNA-binding MarR family transcriptional regulator
MSSSPTPLAMLLDAFTDVRRELSKQLEGEFAGETTMLATETLVLAELHQHSIRTPSDLASATGLSRGRMSHLLDSLESHNLVERHQSEDDRRRFIVTLTGDGRLAARNAAERVDAVRALSADVLGPAGLESMYEQLRRLQRATRERRERGVHGPQRSVADTIPGQPRSADTPF